MAAASRCGGVRCGFFLGWAKHWSSAVSRCLQLVTAGTAGLEMRASHSSMFVGVPSAEDASRSSICLFAKNDAYFLFASDEVQQSPHGLHDGKLTSIAKGILIRVQQKCQKKSWPTRFPTR